jgi:hypothetical protein
MYFLSYYFDSDLIVFSLITSYFINPFATISKMELVEELNFAEPKFFCCCQKSLWITMALLQKIALKIGGSAHRPEALESNLSFFNF